jgi:hypothetical protein
MLEIEALADCLRVVVEEVISAVPEPSREGTRLAMALFVRADLGHTDPAALALIARVFSLAPGTI